MGYVSSHREDRKTTIYSLFLIMRAIAIKSERIISPSGMMKGAVVIGDGKISDVVSELSGW